MGQIISMEEIRARRGSGGVEAGAEPIDASAVPASTPVQPLLPDAQQPVASEGEARMKLPGPTAEEMQRRARAKQLEDTKRLALRRKHGTDGGRRS